MCNRLYLGTRFPAWVRRVLPDAALWIREEWWGAYPYTFCRYTSELWPRQLEFTIESLHVANDVGETDGIFGDMTATEQRECNTQLLDIAAAPTKSTPGVFQGDPTTFKSIASGRGSLSGPGWWKRSASTTQPTETVLPSVSSLPASEARQPQDPVMCIYKRAQCRLYCIPFSSRIERITLDSTVRDMAVLGFRNLFCWTDCWFHLSHADLTQFEEKVKLQLTVE